VWGGGHKERIQSLFEYSEEKEASQEVRVGGKTVMELILEKCDA